MEKKYKIGGSVSPITLAVNINSDGMAATAVNLVTLPAGPLKQILKSEDANGDIPESAINQHDSLKGKRLQVFTVLNFTGGDANTRKASADATTGTYTLDGGEDGKKIYSPSTRDFNDPRLILDFLIDLI
jgi:hypothetical protein